MPNSYLYGIFFSLGKGSGLYLMRSHSISAAASTSNCSYGKPWAELQLCRRVRSDVAGHTEASTAAVAVMGVRELSNITLPIQRWADASSL
jgi:hypothetical protein